MDRDFKIAGSGEIAIRRTDLAAMPAFRRTMRFI